MTPLTYDTSTKGPNPDGIVHPGLSARCKVLFNPVNLNDLESEIKLSTEVQLHRFFACTQLQSWITPELQTTQS